MDHGPLVTDQINAGAELIRRIDSRIPVRAAFWLKASDDPYRYLYLVSDEIDDTNVKDAYGVVLDLVHAIHSPFLDPFRVNLLSADHPLARAALEMADHYSELLPTFLGSRRFGDTWIDDGYVYSAPLSAVASS
jgi:hypothetical protein